MACNTLPKTGSCVMMQPRVAVIMSSGLDVSLVELNFHEKRV